MSTYHHFVKETSPPRRVIDTTATEVHPQFSSPTGGRSGDPDPQPRPNTAAGPAETSSPDGTNSVFTDPTNVAPSNDDQAHPPADVPSAAAEEAPGSGPESRDPNRGLFGRIWDGFTRLFPPWLLRFWPVRITLLTISLIRRNRVMSLAAEIAYWSVLSVVPLLLVLGAALGWLDSIIGADIADEARRELSEAVTDLLGTAGTASTSIDNLFAAPALGAFTVGLITAIYSSSRGFISLVGALGLISGHQNQRNWIMTRVVGVLVMILSLLVLLALLVILGIGSTGFGLDDPWRSWVAYSIWPVAGTVIIVWAAVLLHAAPRERTPLRLDLPGALLTALWWAGGSWVAARYISATASATDVLGLLGSGVGVLIWLYIISAGILIGAQLNSALRKDRERKAAHRAT